MSDTNVQIAENILDILDIPYVSLAALPANASLAIDSKLTASNSVDDLRRNVSDVQLKDFYTKLFISWFLCDAPLTPYCWGSDVDGSTLPYKITSPYYKSNVDICLYKVDAGLSATPDNMILVAKDHDYESVCRDLGNKVFDAQNEIYDIIISIACQRFDIKCQAPDLFLQRCNELKMILAQEEL